MKSKSSEGKGIKPTDYDKYTQWAEREIKEYQKFIVLLKSLKEK